jgi:drug/metabolite transporter (DMT)-like permease
MSQTSQLVPTGYGLAAVLFWGTSDFLGGYASRSANAMLVATITNGSGFVAIILACILTGVPFPDRASVIWGLLGGAFGGTALAFFYRALAAGNMGLTAPISALLSAAIPTVFTLVTEGWPHYAQVAGFVLAGIAIWLISRSEDGFSPKGIGLAFIAGLGFAGFYLCIRQAGNASALWLAAASRTGALVCTATLLIAQRAFRPFQSQSAAWAVVAGFLDVSGSVVFIRASQTGRLDAAVILASLYPVVTVLLARIVLKEQFTRWKTVGMLAALAAVPLITS